MTKFSSKMAANESGSKSKKKDEKLNSFVCPVTYSSQLPNPGVDCKFLPCGKTLMDFTVDPVSFPLLETQFDYQFKGLHLLFDIDLVNHNAYIPSAKDAKQLDAKDMALLVGIEPLHNKPLPRAQECREPLAMERTMDGEMGEGNLEVESLSLEQQNQIIQQTFVDIEMSLANFRPRTESEARPIAQLPIFPAPTLPHELVQINYGIPPSDSSNGLLKDCGNHLVYFKMKGDPRIQQKGLHTYVSEQRYKEERSTESLDRRFERFLLWEQDGIFYYTMVNKLVKLRQEQPRQHTTNNVCLLQMKSTEASNAKND